MDIELDADGVHGAPGMHGGPGHDGYGSGADGGRGGDAGPAQPGEDGGEVSLQVATGADARIDITGVAHPVSREATPVDVRVPAGDLGWIVVHALGGRGGDGGDGGPGGHGARGSRGSDATRHSSGSDGGPGGDGGDGGHGGNGAAGGRGGTIRVYLAERDTYLLMAIDAAYDPSPLVCGGPGGKAGRHGTGGAGGDGGPGGASHHWTETYTDTETYWEGGRSRTRTVTRTRHCSNSGGSRGRAGSNGWTPNVALSGGIGGGLGAFEIAVDVAGAVRRFASRYDFELASFELAEDPDEEPDGILEFAEVVRVRKIRLRNIGGMPSPPAQRVRVTLAQSTWVRPGFIADNELFVARSVDVGEEYEVPGTLRFVIARPQIEEPADPLVVTDTVRPLADQLGPEGALFVRRYDRVQLGLAFTAQFPVQNHQGVIGLRSVAPGESTLLAFDVANVSRRGIGRDSPCGRKVGVQLELHGGDLGADDVQFVDADGQEVRLDGEVEGFGGWFVEVPSIAAHQSVHVGGRFGIRDHVNPYTGASLRFTLWLEDVRDPSKWVVAQRRAVTIRAEPAYRYDDNARVLLVTHDGTTREAYVAWQELLRDQLGLPFSSWSLSRYGHFDHEVELEDGTDLRAHLEDRLAVVLDQPFHPRHDAQQDRPTEYIKGSDVRRGATGNNTHLLIVGSKAEFRFEQWLEPTTEVRLRGDDYPDVRSFLRTEARTGGPLTQETFKDDITLHADRVATHALAFPFFRPSAGKTYKRARKIQRKLSAMHPNRRYVVVVEPHDEPKKAGRFLLFIPRYEVGTVEVRRTLNIESSSMVHIDPGELDANEARFIFGDGLRYAVLLALPFHDKLERLDALMRADGDLVGHATWSAGAVIRAILADLSAEQSAFLRGAGSVQEQQLHEKLSNLQRLVGFPLWTMVPASSNKWGFLLDLFAGLEALCRVRTRWWRWWGRTKRMVDHVQEQLVQLRMNLLDGAAVDIDGEIAMSSATAAPAIEERVATLVALEQQQADVYLPLLLEHPRVGCGIVRDIDAWLQPAERIWSRPRLKQAIGAEALRSDKQTELRQLNAATRTQLALGPGRPPPAAITAAES